MPDPLTIFYAGLILAAAATLQSAIGFGFALISIPVMVAVLGLDPEDSIAMVTVCSMGQAIVSGWHLRHDIPWKMLVPMALVGWLFIVPGMMALEAVKSLSKAGVNQVFGGIVLFALLITTVGRIKPREHVPRIWGYVAVSFGAFHGRAVRHERLGDRHLGDGESVAQQAHPRDAVCALRHPECVHPRDASGALRERRTAGGTAWPVRAAAGRSGAHGAACTWGIASRKRSCASSR